MTRHFNGVVSRFSAGSRGPYYSVTVRLTGAAGVPAAEFEAHDVRLNGTPVVGVAALAAGGWLEFTVRQGDPATAPLAGVIGRVVELAVSDSRRPHSPHAVTGRITGVAVDPAAPDGRKYKMLVAPLV